MQPARNQPMNIANLSWVALHCVLWLVCTLGTGSAWARETLILHFMVSSGAQRTAWVSLVQGFAAAHPDIRVVHKEFAQEQYKQHFERYLTEDKVDIAFWFAGERMQSLVHKRLLAPLDPGFVNSTATQALARAPLLGGVVGGQHYAFPVTYYPWGFFYRKSTFARLGLAPPQDWASFVRVCETLKAAGITPTAVGAQAGWPAAAWFDYLNLRSNGLEFHQKLLRGETAFSDPRARQVLELWKKLLDQGYFLNKTLSTDWDSVLPFLYREQVGMVLLGGFAAAKFVGSPFANDIGFFAFPRINSKIPTAEDAPLDVLVLPASGENRATAHRFLRYLATQPALNRFNDAVGTISPLARGQSNTDPLFRSGKAVLDAAAGLSFYFDRDAPADLIQPAFGAFQQFLQPPHDVDAAIRSLDLGRRPLP